MVKVVTSYNNFARAKIDHDMMGRYDLPVYNSAADVFQNFFSNFKGNAIYRTGFEDMLGEEFQDCVMYEFKFRDDQNYIMVFYENTIRFLSYDVNGNFGWVLASTGPDVILEVATSYTLAQCRELQFTQNADVVIVTHQAVAPQKITRVSSTSFTIGAHTMTGISLPSMEYPKCCLFYKGRLYFANCASKPTTIWASENGDYEEFTVPGTATDISPLQFTIADIAQPISWLFGGDNSLIVGCSEGIVAVNGGGVNQAIKADTIEANLTSADGSNTAQPFKKDGLIFYVGKNSRNMYYFSYDLLTESFLAEDANFISYDITKGGITKIRHKKDRNDLIFGIRGDGALVSLNFKEKENIIGWHLQKTRTGDQIKDIVVISDNEGDPQLFALVMRGSDYFIERLTDHIEFSERVEFFTDDEDADKEAYNRKVSEELNQCIYLDSAVQFSNLQSNLITYDPNAGTITATNSVFVDPDDIGKHISYKTETGYESGRFRILSVTSNKIVEVEVLQEPTDLTWTDWYLSFQTVSGLDKFDGETVGAVTDGGYLDDFEVTGGEVDLGNPVLSVVFGYRYKGIIKSFCLGFQAGAENTQTTMKAVTQVGLRCVASAGGEFGTSLYRLEPVQELSQNDINYLPPLPIDGTKYVSYGDDNQKDKFFYIVQNLPLPFTVTSVMIDANYSVTR